MYKQRKEEARRSENGFGGEAKIYTGPSVRGLKGFSDIRTHTDSRIRFCEYADRALGSSPFLKPDEIRLSGHVE